MPSIRLVREEFIAGQKLPCKWSVRIETTSVLVHSFFAACFNDSVKELQELLQSNNVDINKIQIDDGKTLLMFAAQNQRVLVLKFLLAHPGIDVSVKDKLGMTALNYLLKPTVFIKKNFVIAEDVIKHGADIDLVDNDGHTHLLRAWIENERETAKQLIRLGAKIEFSEDLLKKDPNFEYVFTTANQLQYDTSNFCSDDFLCEGRAMYMTSDNGNKKKEDLLEQIKLSKQFLQELQQALALEQAKWLGVAASCICFDGGKIVESLLKSFLVDPIEEASIASKVLKIKPEKKYDSEIEAVLDNVTKILETLKEDGNDKAVKMRRAFDLGFGMMKNRLIKGEHAPVRFYESIPPNLLFTPQIEHRERELANEICWQQWCNNYDANFPSRKGKDGYGPGAMVLARPKLRPFTPDS